MYILLAISKEIVHAVHATIFFNETRNYRYSSSHLLTSKSIY